MNTFGTIELSPNGMNLSKDMHAKERILLTYVSSETLAFLKAF